MVRCPSLSLQEPLIPSKRRDCGALAAAHASSAIDSKEKKVLCALTLRVMILGAAVVCSGIDISLVSGSLADCLHILGEKEKKKLGQAVRFSKRDVRWR